MQGHAIRYRYEDAFFLEHPPRGRFEAVIFKIDDIQRINDDGRYPTEASQATSGKIYFGLDEQTNRMIYYQFPPDCHPPGGLFVHVTAAAVYKNWQQYPKTSVSIDCIE